MQLCGEVGSGIILRFRSLSYMMSGYFVVFVFSRGVGSVGSAVSVLPF